MAFTLLNPCAAATIKGQDIREAFADLRGLTVGRVADRRFMVVDNDYKHLTQREIPKLATVQAELLRGAGGVFDKTSISAGGTGSFLLDPQDVSGTRITAEMHKKKKVGETVAVREKVPAHIMKGPGTEWFRDFLGRKDVHLVYQADNDIRISDRSFATGPGKNNPVSFGDGFAILLTSTATLAKLNGALDNLKPMDRFRPNIVIDGPSGTERRKYFCFRSIWHGRI